MSNMAFLTRLALYESPRSLHLRRTVMVEQFKLSYNGIVEA